MSAAAVPAAPVPLRSWANRYASTCDTCGAPVARNAGTVRRAGRRDSAVRDAGRRWVVTCGVCTCVANGIEPNGVRVEPAPDAPVLWGLTAPVVEPAPRKTVKRAPAKVSDGYTVPAPEWVDADTVRIGACVFTFEPVPDDDDASAAMIDGMRAARAKVIASALATYRPTAARKPYRWPGAVKPGTAAHAKLQASVYARLASIETDERGFITSMGKGCYGAGVWY